MSRDRLAEFLEKCPLANGQKEEIKKGVGKRSSGDMPAEISVTDLGDMNPAQ